MLGGFLAADRGLLSAQQHAARFLSAIFFSFFFSVMKFYNYRALRACLFSFPTLASHSQLCSECYQMGFLDSLAQCGLIPLTQHQMSLRCSRIGLTALAHRRGGHPCSSALPTRRPARFHFTLHHSPPTPL